MTDAGTPLRVLFVEDSAHDAALLVRELRKAGYAPAWERVEAAGAMRAALAEKPWDIVFCDYVIPGFGGMEALQIARESALDLPVILISGKIGEETAVEAMRAGATDVVMKDRLGRLGSVVKRELTDAAARRGLRLAQVEWRAAFDSIRDAIFVVDAELRVLRANLSCATLARTPIQQVIGKHYWEAFPDLAGPLEVSRTSMAGGESAEEDVRLPDGRSLQARVYPVLDNAGKFLHSLHVLQDTTERKRAERLAEARLRRAQGQAEAMNAVISSAALLAGDVEALAAEITEQAARAAGVARANVWLFNEDETELRCIDLYEAGPARHSAGMVLAQEQFAKEFQALKTARYVDADEPATDPRTSGYADAYLKPLGITSLLDAVVALSGRHLGLLCLEHVGKAHRWEEDEIAFACQLADKIALALTNRDRRRAQEALARRERYFRKLIEGGADAFFVIDRSGAIVYRSASGTQLTGWSEDDVMGKDITEYVVPEYLPRVRATIAATMRYPGRPTYTELRLLRKDGTTLDVEATGRNLIADPDIGGIVVTARDISGRKRDEEALRASRDLLRSVIDHTPVRVFWKDLELRYLGCNSLFARDAGMARPEDLIGKDDFQMGWREQAESYRADDQRVIDSNAPRLGIEEPQSTADGRTTWLRTSKVPLQDAAGKAIGVLGVYDDITERKQAEEELERLNWAMRALSLSNSALVHAGTDEELFRKCCESIAATDAYPLAWIGLLRDDPARSVEPVASAGLAAAYLDGIVVTASDTPQGSGPTGVAIRTGVTQVVDEIASERHFAPWLERARAHGLASSISLPIYADGSVIGALMVYGREAHAFGKAEIALFEELAGNIAYGVAARRMRGAYESSVAEQVRSAAKLRKSLEDSIQAIAATVEMRDPYTAGHERRVAELAAAIATEMDLPQSTVEGIRFGGMIHDLGKIQIPAEILSKPTRISPVEYELIKGHAQSGFEILRGIDFPWPVAEMARQHHERLDGSGYPQGLKGEAILLEARVLAVADTVEAMASHRPYRPGLGVEVALGEIEKCRGTQYDEAVVDACLRLFRAKGYQLPA